MTRVSEASSNEQPDHYTEKHVLTVDVNWAFLRFIRVGWLVAHSSNPTHRDTSRLTSAFILAEMKFSIASATAFVAVALNAGHVQAGPVAMGSCYTACNAGKGGLLMTPLNGYNKISRLCDVLRCCWGYGWDFHSRTGRSRCTRRLLCSPRGMHGRLHPSSACSNPMI
jgi:hypothetical protein